MSGFFKGHESLAKVPRWLIASLVFAGMGFLTVQSLLLSADWFAVFLGDARLIMALVGSVFAVSALSTLGETLKSKKQGGVLFELLILLNIIVFSITVLITVQKLWGVIPGWRDVIAGEWGLWIGTFLASLAVSASMMPYFNSLWNDREKNEKRIQSKILRLSAISLLMFFLTLYLLPLSASVLNTVVAIEGGLAVAYVAARVAYRKVDEWTEMKRARLENGLTVKAEEGCSKSPNKLNSASAIVSLLFAVGISTVIMGAFSGLVSYYTLYTLFSSMLPASLMPLALPLSVTLSTGLGLYAGLFTWDRYKSFGVASMIPGSGGRTSIQKLLKEDLFHQTKAAWVVLSGLAITGVASYYGWSFLAHEVGLEVAGWNHLAVVALTLSVVLSSLPYFMMNAIHHVRKYKHENLRTERWESEVLEDFIVTERKVSAACAGLLGVSLSFVLAGEIFGEGLFPHSVWAVLVGSLLAVFVGYGQWVNATEFAHTGDDISINKVTLKTITLSVKRGGLTVVQTNAPAGALRQLVSSAEPSTDDTQMENGDDDGTPSPSSSC